MRKAPAARRRAYAPDFSGRRRKPRGRPGAVLALVVGAPLLAIVALRADGTVQDFAAVAVPLAILALVAAIVVAALRGGSGSGAAGDAVAGDGGAYPGFGGADGGPSSDGGDAGSGDGGSTGSADR